MDFVFEDVFYYIYIASALIITWYRPFISTRDSDSADYHLWIAYWVVLSGLLFIETNIFPEYSKNLGYYFLRTLFFFYLAERKMLENNFDGPATLGGRIMQKIGSTNDVRVLCSMMDSEEEINDTGALHPWAPTPNTVGLLAICRIGEKASLKEWTNEDCEFIIANALDKIVAHLDDPENAKSYNCLLCLLFLSDRPLIRNKVVELGVLPRVKRFIMDKRSERQLVESALRLCRNVYNFNQDLQQEFIKLGMCGRLLECLKEFDPLAVFEAFENIFSLICVRNI